jgi:hypothetical protein
MGSFHQLWTCFQHASGQTTCSILIFSEYFGDYL